MVAVETASEQLPSYFTREFFETSLCSDVSKFSASLAVGKGENYTSSLYRVRIEKDNGASRSIIVKSCPEEGKMKDLLNELGIYDKESLALARFIPTACEMLEKSGVGAKISPDLLYFRNESPSCIILEDLLDSGYKLADRKIGLDLQHSKLVMSKIAKLHAAGKILFEKKLPEFAIFKESFYDTQKTDTIEKFHNTCTQGLISEMETWEEEYQGIRQKLEKQINHFAEKGHSVIREDCQFKVFNHGDLWSNNIMFKYNDDEVEDAVMVDFQCSFYGSPATDLNYFISGSTNEDVFWNSRDELVEYYHDNLLQALEALGYSGYVPTLDDILKEMKKCEFISVYTVTCLKSIFMNEKLEEGDDLSDELSGTQSDGLRRRCANPKFVNILKRRLKYMDKQGMID